MICDLAEVYHIYDYKSLPATLVAIFACGLERGARVWKKLNGGSDFDLELKVAAYDCLRLLVWLNSSDAQEGINRPTPLYQTLFGKQEENDTAKKFATPEDFRTEWEKINGDNS